MTEEPDPIERRQKEGGMRFGNIDGDMIGNIIAGHDVHLYFEGRYAPLCDKFISAEYLLARGKPKSFVGRDFLKEQIEQFLDETDRGYFLLIGPPGIGKTAFAAYLVNTLRCPYHFVRNPDVRDARQARFNLCAQLIARHELPITYLPPEAGDNNDFLQKILNDISASFGEHGKIIVVIDAIDEADRQEHCAVPFLPEHLPAGIYIVVTQRPSSERLIPTLSPETQARSYFLQPDNPYHITDIREFVERRTIEPVVAKRLSSANITPKKYTKILLEKGQGNFMFVDYVLAAVAENENGIDALEKTPDGLSGYYQQLWMNMGSARREGREEWKKLYRPVAGILAVAQRPLSTEEIAAFAGPDVETEDVTDYVVSRWRHLLDTQEIDGIARWSIYHDSFRSFLLDVLEGTLSYHIRIVEHYERFCQGNWSLLDRYGFEHLVYHYSKARSPTELLDLLRSSFLVEKRRNMDLASLQQDITIAQLSLANAKDYDGLLYLFLLELGLQQRLTTSGFPPFEFAGSALSGHWQQAFERAQALPDPDERLMTMSSLVSANVLAGHEDISEILNRIDEHMNNVSIDAVGRSAVFVSLGDYKLAYLWLTDLASLSDHPWMRIFEDRGNRMAACLMLLRNWDLESFMDALMFLERLLFHGGPNRFRGLESPHGVTPGWLSDQYRLVLSDALARDDMRGLGLLLRVESYSLLINSFEQAISVRSEVAVNQIVETLISHSHLASETSQDEATLHELLGICASRMLDLMSQNVARVLALHADVRWRDAVVNQAVVSGIVVSASELERLLETVESHVVLANMAQFLILNPRPEWDLRFRNFLSTTLQHLITRLHETEMLENTFPQMLDILSEQRSAATSLRDLWNVFGGIEALKPFILKQVLSASIDYGLALLRMEPITEKLCNQVSSWLKENWNHLNQAQTSAVIDWLDDQIDCAESSSRIHVQLIKALAYLNAEKALEFVPELTNDNFDLVQHISMIAAQNGLLPVLEPLVKKTQEFDVQYRAYNLRYLLAEIYAYQPDYVKNAIEELNSELYQGECWIEIAQSLMPNDINQAWSIMQYVGTATDYGIFSSDYKGVDYSDNSEYQRLKWLLGHPSYKGMFDAEDCEKVLRWLNTLEISDRNYDSILEHLIHNLRSSEPQQAFGLYKEFTKGTRLVLRHTFYWSFHPTYIELCLQHDSEAVVAELCSGNLVADVAKQIGDVAFWYLLIVGDLELAGRIASSLYESKRLNNTGNIQQLIVPSILAELASRNIIGIDTFQRQLQLVGLTVPQIIDEIVPILGEQTGPITEVELHLLEFAWHDEPPNPGERVLDAIKKRQPASINIAEQIWNDVPHESLPRELLENLATSFGEDSSSRLEEVIDYLCEQDDFRSIPMGIMSLDGVATEMRRRLLDHIIENIESMIEAGDDSWGGYTGYICDAALAVLPQSEFALMAGRVSGWIFSINNGSRRHYYAKAGLCRFLLVIHPEKAFELADELDGAPLRHALFEIAKRDPAALIDYVLKRKQQEYVDERDRILLTYTGPYGAPFLKSVRELQLSSVELRHLIDKVVFAGEYDSLNAILAGVLAQEGNIDQAVDCIRTEFRVIRSNFVRSQVSKVNAEEMGRIMDELSLDDEARETIYLDLISLSDVSNLDRVEAYYGRLCTSTGSHRALKALIMCPGYLDKIAKDRNDLYSQLIRLAVEADGGLPRYHSRKTVEFGIDTLEPDESAIHCIKLKQTLKPSFETIGRWTVRTYQHRPLEVLLSSVASMSTDVDRQLDSIFRV